MFISKEVTLKVKGSMEIAHRLPNYDGKCSKLHGHRVEYIVSFKGEPQKDGMVEDFKELDKFIKLVSDRYDHTYLNDIFELPTLEDFARHFLNELNIEYGYAKQREMRGRFVELEMWETNKYGVVITYDQ